MANGLEHYLETWALNDPERLAQTPTSHVYTVTTNGTRAVLKLLTPVGVADEQSGAAALRWWDGRGAVRLLRADEGAHLLEYADGDELTTLVERGDDAGATVIIAAVLNQLHAAAPALPPDGLKPLRGWFRSLFNKAAMDRQNGVDSIYVRAGCIAEALFAQPLDVCVLHGDIHHANIRHRAGRGWLAFDPKGLLGERTYDAANTLCNPLDMPALVHNEARLLNNAAILAQGMGVDRVRLLAFVYVYTCLSASWYVEDGEEPSDDLTIAGLVEPHLGAWLA